jgi:hypothetical protein
MQLDSIRISTTNYEIDGWIKDKTHKFQSKQKLKKKS